MKSFSLFVNIFALLCLTNLINSAKILSVSFVTSKSHKITYDPLLNELAKRGHEVTVLSPIPSKKNTTNPREILTSDFQAVLDHAMPDLFQLKTNGEDMNPIAFVNVFEDFCRSTYALPQVQEIMKQKFDLILFEPFLNECTAGYLHKLNTSVILISPFSVAPEVMRMMGGPAPPSFVPNINMPFDNKMNFVERIRNFLYESMETAIKAFYFNPKMEAVYRESLNDPNLPGIHEILKNASLVFSNSHLALGGTKPFLPDFIEVGGMHMRKAKPLPKDLEDFAKSSGEHGFIFFSMGSILQSSRLPESNRKALLNAFAKLKQKVLWKWETDSMPDLPPNVKLIKWAPQQDVLAHPKCKAFITHGGLGGTTEAIYHGVPMIGIPMFGDQLTNMIKFTRMEIALSLEFNSLDADTIVQTVETVINDPKYANNVKRISKIFRDQKDDPLERAVFWTEYVLRHQGAVHLRSPSRDLNFFQYHSLDVIFSFLTAIFIVLYVILTIARKILGFCCGSRTNSGVKVSAEKKKN